VGTYALDLNGTSQYAAVPDDASLDLTNQITLAAWIRPAEYDTADLIKKATNASIDGYELSLATTKNDLSSRRPFFRINQVSKGDTYRVNATTVYPIDGTWMHVAATFDGTAMRLYINGVLEATMTPPAGTTIATNDLPLTVGAQDGTTASRWFMGQMDDVRVYNRALSLSEIQALAGVVAPTCYPLTLTSGSNGSAPTANPLKSAGCAMDGQYTSGEVIQLTAAPASGYHVSAWSGTDDDASTALTNQLTMPAADHNVNVTYAADQYTLTVVSDHGTVSKNPDKTTYTYGEVVQLTATPGGGWAFASWTGDASGSQNPIDVTIAGNMTVTANYSQHAYILTITSEHGTVAKSPDNATYTYGEVVQLTAAPAAGWTFVSWSGAATGTANPVEVTMDGDKSVTANYSQNEYTLTVDIVGNGSVSRNPDQDTYLYGDSVQLTAAAASGWIFDSWSGDLTGSANPASITMDGNKTVTATFTSTNTAPVAVDDSYPTNEDTALTITAPGVLANDTDTGPLTASKVSNPTHGTLQFNPDGSFTYTPAADYHGSDSFTYKASDGSLDSNVATVTIAVAPVNDAPVAEPKTVQVDEDGSIAVTLSGSDPDGDTLTFSILTPPDHGMLSGTAPDLTYAPGLNYNGPDRFTFQVSDGFLSAQADLTIDVRPGNDSPVAVGDAYATDENTALDVSEPGVLANDTDVDGDPLSTILVNDVSHGSLTLDAAGSFHYAPQAGFSGEDHFSYKANDGTADSSDVTVTIKVNTVNHAPAARDDNYSSGEDLVLSVAAPGVMENDTDTDGDALSAILVRGTSHGVLNFQADGSFSYVPELNWYGMDSFTYKVSDTLAESNTATVTITISPVNDPPVATAQAVSVDEEGSLAITLAGSDADGDPLTFAIATNPANGTLSGAPPDVTYAPNGDFSGNDAFTFTVNDGQATSAPAAVSIAVNAINDAPVCRSLNLVTDENVSVSGSPDCTDVDNPVLSYQIVTPAQHGTASISGSLLSYSPNANYYGADNFSYQASDGALDSNVAAVSVTVNSVNNAPVANDDSATTPQDTPVTIPVLGNDSDADGDSLSITAVSTPVHGTTIINPDKTVTYTPAAGWYGSDSFTYTISDGHNGTASATVNIAVSQSQNDWIFKDSFDTCNASAWSTTMNSAALTFTNAAAWDASCGMAVSLTTNSPAYVRDTTPTAEARYRARFYFNPNSLRMAKNEAHAILNAYNAANAPVLTIELRLSGKNYQVRAGVLTDRKKWTYTSWASLANGWQPVEVDWRAATAAGANNGALTLWVGGVQAATLSAVDNDTQRVESVALGAVEGVDAGTRGTYFFDAFESRRP
jgi:uncharacterized repeat protein (TIGR02543 family)